MTADRDWQEVHAGVLLGTFAADALGARWEGAGATGIDRAHRRLAASLEAPELRYTDDTQLTLALAEHLCTEPDVDPAGLITTFLDHFEDWRGYARGMHGIVAAWRDGLSPEAAATAVFGDGSFGNGAAMRVAPVGAVHAADPQRVAQVAARQAVLTHAHPVGVDAAVVQARAVATAAATGKFGVAELRAAAAVCATDDLRDRMTVAVDQAAAWQPLADPRAVADAIGTDVRASHSVAAALWVAAVATDVRSGVVLALALGGDVDTIAAMACAVIGAALGARAIPPEWVDLLEDGPRGRSYALSLADRLAARR
jgi:poly(ADP-ribose) glycohydrolase ARH3